MDDETYRRQYFVDPAPEPQYGFEGLHGTTLYFADYATAVDYYRRVLGPPAYVEGAGTHGWRLGNTWLTLLEGGSGHPRNVEITLVMTTAAEAERLQAAFIAAGGQGQAPSDQLMYAPIRYCPVSDPFGTNWLIVSPLAG
jgi:hypothetical protein